MKKVYLLIILCYVFVLSRLPVFSLPPHKVIVLGNEPECITAAVTASRRGYSVTLITTSQCLGGLLTEGMLTALDINFNYQNKVLHNGFFKEFLDACSNGYNVDYHLVQNFFNKTIKDHHINVIFNASELKPIIKNNQVTGVCYLKEGNVQKEYADFIIDGSSEAEFTRRLGASYKKGRSEFGKPDEAAAATLIFSVKDVDWHQVSSYLNNDDYQFTGAKRSAAWGYNVMYNCRLNHPRLQMRGLNLSRQNDGSVVINALLIFNVDPLKKQDTSEVYHLAKKELPDIVKYMSIHCPGFENASLDKVASKLYIREGVRITCEDTLTGNDVYEHIDFTNTIAYGSYPMDLQATKRGEYGNALCGKCLYSIPLGAMIPKGVENVLVIGRSAGFDIMAHGSARTIPVLMSMAENGILAMDYSFKHHINLRQLNQSYEHLAQFYKTIYSINGFRRLTLPQSALSESWYYPYIHNLRSKGYFSLGYAPYDLEDTDNTKKTINSTLSLLISYSDYMPSDSCRRFIHQIKNTTTAHDLCKLASYMLCTHFETPEDLLRYHVIDFTTYHHIVAASALSHGEVYAVLDGIIKKAAPYKPLIIYQDAVDVICE